MRCFYCGGVAAEDYQAIPHPADCKGLKRPTITACPPIPEDMWDEAIANRRTGVSDAHR